MEKENVEGMQVDKATAKASSPYLYLLPHIKVHGVKRMTMWTEAGRENPGEVIETENLFHRLNTEQRWSTSCMNRAETCKEVRGWSRKSYRMHSTSPFLSV